MKNAYLLFQLLLMLMSPFPTETEADCGVFVIAFAVAICNGQNPEEITFQIPKMCHHLSDCLEDKQISALPSKYSPTQTSHLQGGESFSILQMLFAGGGGHDLLRGL